MITFEPVSGQVMVASDRGGNVPLRFTPAPRPDLNSRDEDMRVWVKSRKDALWVRGVSKQVFVVGGDRVEMGVVLHLIGWHGDVGTTVLEDVVSKY